MIGDDARAIPVPTPLTVKSGSRRLLSATWPDLAGRPRSRLPNGRTVTHVAPPIDQVLHTPQTVSCIMFLIRGLERDGPMPIAPAVALARLLDLCLALPRDLTRADVGTLVSWIGGVRSFVFPVGEPGNAARAIEQLVLQP